MFRNILPAVLAIVALSGCSVYRSGQTPDDVYYSPGRSEDSYVTVDNTKNSRSYGRGDYYNPDDNYLRMRVNDRYRWSTFDDYNYMNDWQYSPGYYGAYSPYTPYSPYSWYSPYSFNAYWNSYYYWNSFYNPYCPSIIVVSPKANPVVYNRVRNLSVSSYTGAGYNTRNASTAARNSFMYRSAAPNNNNARYNNSNSNLGGSIRKAFSGSNDNGSYYTPSSSSSDRPVRTYTPSSSSGSSGARSGGGSSGGSSGGGGGGGVTRPGRG